MAEYAAFKVRASVVLDRLIATYFKEKYDEASEMKTSAVPDGKGGLLVGMAKKFTSDKKETILAAQFQYDLSQPEEKQMKNVKLFKVKLPSREEETLVSMTEQELATFLLADNDRVSA